MAFQQITLAQMRQLLLEKVDSVPFWVDQEANDAINEGLLFWNALTGYWRGVQTSLTTPGSWDYAVPAGLVFGTRVELDGRVLDEASLLDMDAGHPGWQGQTTATGGSVPTQVQNWFPMSIDLIGIWPADAVGGKTLSINGVMQTPRLTIDDDFIDIGQEELSALLGYALHVLAFKEGGERFAATMPLLATFLAEAAEENDQLNSSDLFRQFIGTDMSRQMLPTRGKTTDYDAFGGRKP